MDVKFLENVIQKSVELCEQYIGLLKVLKRKCNDRDVKFIVEKCETLRSSEKLICLNRSILEETVSMAHKQSNGSSECANQDAGTLTECENPEVVDGLGLQAPGVDEEEVEQKYSPFRTPFYVEKFVNLAEQRVSFKEAVTVVHFSNETDDMPTNRTSSAPSTDMRRSAPKKISSVGASTECESRESDQEEVEQKYRPNGHGTPFYVEKLVNLAEQRVSFKQAVTVVHFSTETEDARTLQSSSVSCAGERSSRQSTSEPSSSPSTGEPLSRPSADEPSSTQSSEESSSTPSSGGRSSRNPDSRGETKKSGTKRGGLQLPPAYVHRIRDGKIDFHRNLKRTVGLCFFCDEQKSFTKLQWQKHLLTHTNENLYACNQCGCSYAKRVRHNNCSPAKMTDIYEQHHCIGENFLAAFMCNICAYVQVGEIRMVEHVEMKHSVKDHYNLSYKKCNFVTNV